MKMQKWEILFNGHVQGVGFRYRAAQLAKQQPICGWVRNLADGRVEMHVQGMPADLEFYLDSVESANAGGIRNIEKIVGRIDPGLLGFQIRQ